MLAGTITRRHEDQEGKLPQKMCIKKMTYCFYVSTIVGPLKEGSGSN